MVISLVFFGILVVAALGGWALSQDRENTNDEAKQTRLISFVLYFWLLVFAQVIIGACIYSVYLK